MENHTETTEKAYKTKEVAELLDMAVPTVRKYRQYLEKAGYTFITSKNNTRLFVEKDIMVLRHMKQLREKTNISVEQATNVVIEKFGKGAIQPVMPDYTPSEKPYEKQYEELEKKVDQQTELINELLTEVKRQNQKQDHLVQYIREIQKVNQANQLPEPEVAATTEKEEKEEKEEKKGFFSKLFGK